MTIQDLVDKKLIIYQVIVGSQAYGTADETSDIDRKGIFMLPIDMLMSDDYIEQVSDESNNNVYYELGKFMHLLAKSDPTVLELLNAPEDLVEIEADVMSIVKSHNTEFITKTLEKSFGEFAKGQIRKARGLNKKINNPISKQRKTPIDFCYVISGYKTYPLEKFLNNNGYNQKFCGVVKIPNAEGIFGLFYDEFSHACFDERISEDDRKKAQSKFKPSLKGYKGIIKETEDGNLVSNDIRYSAIAKFEEPIILFSYNKNGYTKYCKDYKDYWDWDVKKNQARYQSNIQSGKGYDGKNMAHCYRILEMCAEIGEGKGINIRRPNRDKLLSIKYGKYEYDNILSEGDQIIERAENAFKNSNLPDNIDYMLVKSLLKNMRQRYYKFI